MERAFDEMAREAARLESALSPKARDEPRPVFNVRVGDHGGHAFLSTQLARARNWIHAAIRFDIKLEPADLDVIRAIAKAVNRGVHVEAILPAEDLGRATENPMAGDVLELLGPLLGDGLDVRLLSQPVPPFTVIDGESAILAVKNPIDPKRYFAFLYVHDPPFARHLIDKFDELWASSERSVTEAMEMAEELAIEFEP